jgi:diaminopimelate epimerase
MPSMAGASRASGAISPASGDPQALALSCYPPPMQLSFIKMHGLGNDFIVFDVADGKALPSPDTFRRLGNRRTGIGFDQALALFPPRSSDEDVYYRIFNSDGSEVEQCGNGARCIAALVSQRSGKREVRMNSPGGRIRGVVRDDGLVTMEMMVPNFAPESLPFEASREADLYPLRIGEKELQIGAVSMGNPHAVIQVPSVSNADVDTLGPAVQNHSRFPKRANVGFMEVVNPKHIRLRVYERGAGETLACGTGACGAVAIGRRWGLLNEEVQVDAPGGRMIVRWDGPGQVLWLTGPAVKVFEGTVEI